MGLRDVNSALYSSLKRRLREMQIGTPNCSIRAISTKDKTMSYFLTGVHFDQEGLIWLSCYQGSGDRLDNVQFPWQVNGWIFDVFVGHKQGYEIQFTAASPASV